VEIKFIAFMFRRYLANNFVFRLAKMFDVRISPRKSRIDSHFPSKSKRNANAKMQEFEQK